MKDRLFTEAKTKLLDLIKSRGHASVDEATEALGLAKTTVREHLLLLENQNLLLREFKAAGRGRPQLIYRLSPDGNRLYPTNEPALLRELLERLLSEGKQEWVAGFFKEFWAKREETFKTRLEATGKSDLTTRMSVLKHLLREEGFMPEVKRSRSGSVVVRECNCPFPQAVKATQLPCRLEAQFIESALQLPVSRLGFLPSGGTACTYELKSAKR